MPSARAQAAIARTTAVADKVFSTPELLEMILFTFHSSRLQLCRCVSETFKATIEGSVKLKRKYRLEHPSATPPCLSFSDFRVTNAEGFLQPAWNEWENGMASAKDSSKPAWSKVKKGIARSVRVEWKWVEGPGDEVEWMGVAVSRGKKRA